MKTFKLSKQEKTTLEGMQALKAQHDYMAGLIGRDMYLFLQTTVRTRLDIDKELKLSFDVNKGEVYATEEATPSEV